LVLYRSGSVDIDRWGTGDWLPVKVDMEISDDAVIRTGPDSLVEIELDGELVSIGEDRTVAVRELAGRVEKKKKTGLLQSLKRYGSSLFAGSDSSSQTTLTGVRGEEAGETGVEWFEEEELDQSLEHRYVRALARYEAGEYAEAEEELTGLVEQYGPDAHDGRVAYLLGLSLFQVMRFEEATRWLRESTSEYKNELYGMALMHYALSQYFLEKHREAVDGFQRLLREENNRELHPYALFMLGKCYAEMGESRQAERFFREVQQDQPGSELAADASSELQAMGAR
jgi:TolA-binding protein